MGPLGPKIGPGPKILCLGLGPVSVCPVSRVVSEAVKAKAQRLATCLAQMQQEKCWVGTLRKSLHARAHHGSCNWLWTLLPGKLFPGI